MKLWIVAMVGLALTACEPKADFGSPAAVETDPTAAPAPAAKKGPQKVDGAKAKELVGAGAILLDVRTQGEFDGGHIDGAKLIPVQELGGRIDEVGAKDKPVVVYCASGIRSAKAATMLAKAGYGEVYDLGSIRSW